MKESKNINTLLSRSRKKNSFRIPDSYFEEFPQRLMEKLDSVSTPEGEQGSIWSVIRPRLAIAATIIGFALIGYTSVKLISRERPSSEFSGTEIAEYIEYYSSDLDEGIYYEVLDEIYDEESRDPVLNDVIIDYLVDQDIDYLTLIEEL
jgi:hypothetical protein